MLCKTYTWWTVFLTYASDSTQKSATSWTAVTYTIPQTWVSKLDMELSIAWAYTRFDIKKNWTTMTTLYDQYSWAKWAYSYTFNANAWDVITIVFTWETHNATYYSSILSISPNSRGLKVMPKSVKEIWELGDNTLFWKHIDNKFYGWIMLGTVNSATTGNITLWNAVWFIEVNFNWELLKIPYYS